MMTVSRRFTFVLFLLLPFVAAFATTEADTDSTASVLPASVELESRFEEFGLACRSQGNRGTCSVFTIVGAIEFAVGKTGEKTTYLSVEFANWAKNQAMGFSDDGAFFSNTLRGIEKFGISSEAESPYRRRFNPKTIPTDEAIAQAKLFRDKYQITADWIKEWNPQTGLSAGQFLQLKQALVAGNPVCVGLRWPHVARIENSVMMIVPPESVFDGHSVLFVGYVDRSENMEGEGYFLYRNTNNPVIIEKMSYEYAREYTNDALFLTLHNR